jgi:hypothetical protein
MYKILAVERNPRAEKKVRTIRTYRSVLLCVSRETKTTYSYDTPKSFRIVGCCIVSSIVGSTGEFVRGD